MNYFLDLQHPFRCCVFSFLLFLLIFEFHAKWGKKFNFLPNFPIFDLIWHVIKKSAKIHKNEKMQHLMGCFKYKKEFNINFSNFCLFLVYFWTKSGKKQVFCDFRQKLWFMVKIYITTVFLVKFPFQKCIVTIYFNEFL